jgi:tripartite-type tricarboxylate transporter receptor subunit TctC
MERLARAAADGRTLAIAIQANIIGSLMHDPRRYDPLVDLAPIALFATSPMVLAVANQLRITSAAEFIALARSRPGTLTYAASALGGAPHLAGVLFNLTANTDLRLRVYSETDVLYADLEAGRISATFNNIMSALPRARAGELRILAVTGLERSPRAPEIPTMAESALPGYEITNSIGLVAPAATPEPIISRINAAVAKAVSTPEVHQSLFESGMEPVISSPAEFAVYLRSMMQRWSGFINVHRAAFAAPQ